MLRYIKTGMAKIGIEESAAKKQGSIDSGRDVVVGVNKYRIGEDDGDDGNGNGDGNEDAADAADALRIDNAAVRESHIRRLGELSDNRGENELGEALNRIERSAALYEDNNNNTNIINNSNNGKNYEGDVGGRRREEIITSRGDHTQNLLRLSVEAEDVQCKLGEIYYALEKRWVRHALSSSVVSGSYIASFCGGE